MRKTFGAPGLFLAGLLAPPLALVLTAQQGAGLKQELLTVQVRPGAIVTYLGLVGSAKPAGTVVLLAGGGCVLGLRPKASIQTDLRLNFLIRSRELFARQGFYVAALDAPSDREEGMNGAYRLSLQHAHDIGQVIAHLKGRLGVPVWVVGTSSNTLSAVNAAARLPARRVAPSTSLEGCGGPISEGGPTSRLPLGFDGTAFREDAIHMPPSQRRTGACTSRTSAPWGRLLVAGLAAVIAVISGLPEARAAGKGFRTRSLATPKQKMHLPHLWRGGPAASSCPVTQVNGEL
jgi:pimeloyl-ACP methyl ester carboxylesterase